MAEQYKYHANFTMPERRGTIKAHHGADPKMDAETLHNSFTQKDCAKAVMNILTKRANWQRLQIRTAFQEIFAKDLVEELKHHLKSHTRDVAIGLMYRPDFYDAHMLREAMKGLGTHEATLIEILCTRSNLGINDIKSAYIKLHERDLVKDIESETSGHFRTLLVTLLKGNRAENAAPDVAKAAKDALALFNAGEKKVGTDEAAFVMRLATESPNQLLALFQEYEKLTKHSFEQAIEKEFSSDLKSALLTTVKCVKNLPGMYQDKLYHAMKGLGTDESSLNYTIISRSEVDLENIKAAYLAAHKKSLEAAVTAETSGDYKDWLLSILKGNY